MCPAEHPRTEAPAPWRPVPRPFNLDGMKFSKLVVLVLVPVYLAGCASHPTSYERNQEAVDAWFEAQRRKDPERRAQIQEEIEQDKRFKRRQEEIAAELDAILRGETIAPSGS